MDFTPNASSHRLGRIVERALSGTAARVLERDGGWREGPPGGPEASRQPDDGARTAFESFAWLFAPATDPWGCAFIEANERWRFEPAAFNGNECVIWGRLAIRPTAPARMLAFGLRRETGLGHAKRHVVDGLRARDIYRIRPRGPETGLRGAARALLLGGALVRFGRTPPGPRVADALAAEIGHDLPGLDLRSGGDGSARARVRVSDGRPARLRAAKAGGLNDPRRNAAALTMLGAADVPMIPWLVGSGELLGTRWSVETDLGGTQVKQLSAGVLSGALRWIASLPRAPGPPTAPEDRLHLVADAFPRWAAHLAEVGERARAAGSEIPSTVEHGDLWSGNLLEQEGRLSGVVDWDTWHPAGVPGSDLLQLLGMQRRAVTRLELGELWLERPWAAPEFRTLTEPYWNAIGLRLTDELAWLAAVNWWAAHVSAALRRGQRPTLKPTWVARNIDNVVPRLLPEAPPGER